MDDFIQKLKEPNFWVIVSSIIAVLSFVYKIIYDHYESRKKNTESRNNRNKEVRTRTVEKTVHIIESPKTRNSEQPYFAFICMKDISISSIKTAEFKLVFQNKGNGAAYTLKPEIDIHSVSKGDLMTFGVRTTSVALVGETFEISCEYYGYEKSDILTFKANIFFEDASEKAYKQTFEFYSAFGLEHFRISNYTKPVRI